MTHQITLEVARITGQVARILNSRELVINVGVGAGVRKGMRFAVVADPIEVRDPESDELLDVIEREKVRVEAAEVRGRITICRTYRSIRVDGGPLYRVFDPLVVAAAALSGPVTVHDTLESEPSPPPAPLDPEQSYVKPGDRVVQVDEDD